MATKNNNNEDPIVIRSFPSAFLIFGMMAALPLLFAILAVRGGQFWIGLFTLVVGTVIILGSISRFRASWDSWELAYSGILLTVKIRIAEIETFELRSITLKSRLSQASRSRVNRSKEVES